MIDDAVHLAQKVDAAVDAAFEQMAKASQNCVNNLVEWFEEAKVIEKKAVDNAKKLFSEVKDQNNVTLQEFQRVVHTIAEKEKTSIDQLSKALCESVPMKLIGSLDKAFDEMAKEGKNEVDSLVKWLQEGEMEKVFEDLVKNGKNGVDHIVTWLQEAKIVAKTEEAAANAKKMFSSAKDQSKVTIDEFKTAVRSIAEEQKTTFEEMSKTLTEVGPKMMNALGAATTAFKDAMK